MGIGNVNEQSSAWGAAFRNRPIFFMTVTRFRFKDGAFSVADSGFGVDMGALDGRLTPQSSGNMYSDMYKYQFRKVL